MIPAPLHPTTRLTWLWDLATILLLAGLWFCALLGVRPLGNPDEGRYSEIPREMAVTGDFVTPRLNGVKYFEKPPLVYWLSALTFRQFGVNEFTARIWGAIFSVAGVALTYAAGRAIHGRAAGIWAAVVLSTTSMYYVLSQIILLDMAVAVTMSGALFSFILVMRKPPGQARFAMFMAFYAFMALATLSKGLIGIAIPGAIIFLWVLLLNRWRALWPIYPISGTALLLGIAAPWHVFAARANPDFLNFYFVHEHWLRFTTRIHGRYEPWWYFLPVFAVGLFPWVFFAAPVWRDSLAGGWKARRNNGESWFFVLWVVFVIAFFSKSQSKLIPYILPVFPPAAILIGRSVSLAWQGQSVEGIRKGGIAFIAAAFLLVAVAIATPELKDQPELSRSMPVLRIALGGAMVAGAAFVFAGLRRHQPKWVIGAVALSSAALLLSVNVAGGNFEKSSSKKLAKILRPMLRTADRVYSVGTYAQDLPVYLGRLVSVVDYEGELKYGIDAEPQLTSQRFLDPAAFRAQWAAPGAAYAVVRRKDHEKWVSTPEFPHEVLARTHRYVLIGKTPTPP